MRASRRCGLAFATLFALILGLPGIAQAGDRTRDPLGDAPGAPDIIAVTTSVNADHELVIQVELAANWPPGAILNAWFVPDQATYRHRSIGMQPGMCNAYGTGYSLHLDSGRAEFSHHEHQGDAAHQSVSRQVDGTVLTTAIPLAWLGNPTTLGMAITVQSEVAADSFPNEGDCNPVPLHAASVWDTIGPALLVGLAILMGVAALAVAYVLVRRRRGIGEG